jgi:hypothetical protein
VIDPPRSSFLRAGPLLAVALVAAASCSKKQEETSPHAQVDESAPPIPEPPRGPPVTLRLDRLSLVMEAPRGAVVADRSVDRPAVTVRVPGCTIDIAAVSASDPADLAAARERVNRVPDAFHQVTRSAESLGGWHLEYRLQSMVEKRLTYGVQIRATIAGAAYQCGREAPSEAERDCVARACLSLRR